VSAWLEQWNELIAQGNNTVLEERFLGRLESDVSRPEELLEALALLRRRGKKTLAGSLLELAAVEAGARAAWTTQKELLREMLRLGVGEEATARAELEEAVRQVWAGRPSLEMLLKHFNLRAARKPAEALEELELWLAHDVGGVFAMAGRGAGRVVSLNPQLGVLRLDFEREANVPVPIHAAPKHLTPLPPGHFLRRRLEEREALIRQASEDPAGLLEHVLESASSAMSVSELKAALDGIVPAEAWTTWWSKARKHPRLLASGSGARLAYRLASGQAVEEEVAQEFDGAPLAQQLELARRHGARGGELAARMAEVLLERARAAREDPGLEWEAAAVAQRLGAREEAVAQAQERILAAHGAVAVLAALGDATDRESVLEAAKRNAGPWADTFAAWMEREVHPRLLSRLAAELLAGGGESRVVAFLDQVLLHPQRFPAAFAWLCEVGEGDPVFPFIDERRGGSFLLRLVELAERQEMGPVRGRLREVLSPRGLAAGILRDRLSMDQARRLAQVCERPGTLAAERAWLRRAVLARFSELVEPAAREDAVPALASTVARLQEELRRLLDKEIPETLKAIQVAREEGDLRENFEYHAQRARQELLSARAAKLQADLARVVIIDPARVDPSAVRAGTTVQLRQPEKGATRRITVLGPYEGDPEAGILSVGTEVVQGLLGRGVGDEVDLEGGLWVIESIEPASVQ
jgi:transcription elongation GreA/GreB family factor